MTPVSEILMSLMDHAHQDLSLPELLCQDACRRLPISAAGIALMNDTGAIEMTVGSDERASTIEELQLSLSEGPCLDAHATGRLVIHPDLGALALELWPLYTPAVLALGVRAIFSFPLRIGGIYLGVLDLFRDAVGRLDPHELEWALHYVDAAVMVLIHLQSMDRAGPRGESTTGIEGPVELAFHGHPEVHQATGMIAVQAGVRLNEALMLLRARAFAMGRPISEVAHGVVSGQIRFT